MVLRKLRRLFSPKEEPLARFAEKLLRNNCRVVWITPTVYTGRSREYALRFESIIEGGKKKSVKYCETYVKSHDIESKRKNTLALFLYAERRKEDLKKILPDLIVVTIGLSGYPLSKTMMNIIKEEAQLKNAAIL